MRKADCGRSAPPPAFDAGGVSLSPPRPVEDLAGGGVGVPQAGAGGGAGRGLGPLEPLRELSPSQGKTFLDGRKGARRVTFSPLNLVGMPLNARKHLER